MSAGGATDSSAQLLAEGPWHHMKLEGCGGDGGWVWVAAPAATWIQVFSCGTVVPVLSVLVRYLAFVWDFEFSWIVL